MALRALKTDEEINAVPLDQPILVELPTGVLPDEPEDKAPKIDADAKSLQEQLEALQAANKAKDDQVAEANRRAEQARRDADERATALTEASKRTAALEGDVISGGLAAAQGERDAAKASFKAAFEAGDADKMADAQSKIGRAEAKILSYEAGAAEVAQRKEAPAPVERRETPTDPIAIMKANPQLMATEKEWLEKHPDAILDTKRNNRLGVAYDDAIGKGLVRGTPAYFKHLEQFMGYAQPDNQSEGDTDVQAPPSRNERGGDGRPSGGKVTLSPEQREIARSMGVSEIEYARQVQSFDAARRADPEKYNGRG